MKRRRPCGVKFLAFLVLGMVVMNGLRLYSSIHLWGTLVEYEARVSPVYIVSTAVFWMLAGAALLWAIWRRLPWALVGILAGTSIYMAWFWFDRLFLQYANQNWPFMLGASIVILFVILITVFLPVNRTYLHKE